MSADLMAEVGSRVRQARCAVNLRQQDVAERVGLTRSSVANIEAGRQGDISVGTLVALAAALRTTAAVLLGEGELPTAAVAHELQLTTDRPGRRNGWHLAWRCVRRDCDVAGNLTVPTREKAAELFALLAEAHPKLVEEGSR